jgi:predicted MFS family arabinose efflux permease
VGLSAFAVSPVVALAFAALFVSGLGSAGFGSMQGGLTIASVDADARPAAMGLLTTVIGWTLPFGMVLVGVTAELLGARLALVASSVVGLTLLAASLNRYPHVLDQVASTYPGVQPVSVMAPTRISESPAS